MDNKFKSTKAICEMIVWVVLIICSFLYCTRVKADEFHLLQTDEISVEAYKYLGRRDPYQPELNGQWTHGGRFNLNLRVAEYFQWENHLHFAGTEGQLRDAGWEWRAVVDRYAIQPFYWHHSQHALDGSGVGKFPIDNAYGLRFEFYNRRGRKK